MFDDIVIMGAGALGSLFGAMLHYSGFNVTLVGRNPHINKIKEKGLLVRNFSDERLKIPATTKPIEGDLYLLTVKSYDTEQAVRSIPLRENSVILSLQNGLGNEEKAENILGHGRVIGGVTSYGSLFVRPGEIEFTGKGKTYIGEMDGSISSRVREIERILKKAGIETHVVENIRERIWEKLIINSVINPLTAVSRLRNGAIREISHLSGLAKTIVVEAVSVARLHGFQFDADEMYSAVMEVAKNTSRNRSSMLQDIERGKRTEIDEINGMIVKMGREKGYDAVVNRILTVIVRGIQEGGKWI